MNRAIRLGLANMLVGSDGPVLAITIYGRTALRQWLETQTRPQTIPMKEMETPMATPRNEEQHMTTNMIAFLTELRKGNLYYSRWNEVIRESGLGNRAIQLGWAVLKSGAPAARLAITPEGLRELEKVLPLFKKGAVYDPAPGIDITEACREAVRRTPCVLHFNQHYLRCEKGMTAEGLVALWDHERGSAPAPALADAVFQGDKLMRITDLGNGWNDMPPMWRDGPHENMYDNLAHNGYSLEVVGIARRFGG
jgi:hypothetical protein